MPFNGSGSYNLVYNWQTDAANGLNISSSRMQGQDADIAAALSICLTKDGQQQVAANLQMGGFTLTNIANAIAQKQPISVQDFQNGTPTWLGTVSGTDTITGAANIAPPAYAAGQTFRFIAAGSNLTTAVTLNVNGLGPVNVTKLGAVALAIGDIQGGQIVDVTHDGTEFQIKTPNAILVPGRFLNVQRITASGNYTKTPGANAAIVFGAGSGGASGGTLATSSGQGAGAAGGSSGAFGVIYIPSGLANQTVTIGAAGTGTAGAGNAGAACSFGALMVLPGGPGGNTGINTTSIAACAPGGPSAAPTGTGTFLFSSAGLNGSPGFSGTPPIGGNPGISMFGPGGLGSGGTGAGVSQSLPAGNGNPGFTGGFVVFEYS